MIDAQTRIKAILGSANLLSQDDTIEAAQAIEQLGNVIASTNLLASHMMATLSATNSDALEQVEKAFKAAYPDLKSNLDSLTKNNDTAALKDAALKLLAFGDGKTSVFKTRQKELDADDYGQLILDETRKLNVGLGISVKQLVDGEQTKTDATTWQARQEISFATVVMLALGSLTFIGSVLFVWLYVGRNILRRIGNLQRSMQLLSSGDLDTEIHRSRQRDETAIAAAVEERGTATREIARNIQHAAGGRSEVSSNIIGVSTASAEAGTAATEVLSASGALRHETDVLRSQIDALLSNIRAA